MLLPLIEGCEQVGRRMVIKFGGDLPLEANSRSKRKTKQIELIRDCKYKFKRGLPPLKILICPL
jgi:hypothetical protein